MFSLYERCFLRVFGMKYKERGERASEEKVSVEVGVFRCRYLAANYNCVTVMSYCCHAFR